MSSKNYGYEIPIRSKLSMLEDVAQIIHCLHMGYHSLAETLLQDLKKRAVYLDEQIQQDVLAFAGQVAFQRDYDPWHKVTPNVTAAADRLIEDMGLDMKVVRRFFHTAGVSKRQRTE